MSFGFVRPLYDDNRDVHVYNYNREYQLVGKYSANYRY